MPNRDAAKSLMDNSEFIAELETLDGANAAASYSSQLLDHPYEADRQREQRRRHLVVPERSRDHSRRSTLPDRNVFQPTPVDEEVDAEDETSVTISTRAAAFAVMASGLVGVIAAAAVFHARLAVFLR
jgi:hypothetical protein